MRKFHKLLLSLSAFAALASTSSAAILVGDTIVIDFTKNGDGVGGNWNDIKEADNGTSGFDDTVGINSTTIASDLVRFSDGAGTGVGLLAESLGASGNIGIGGLTVSGTDATASFAVSGAIPSTAQLDVSFHVNDPTQFVFTGLDNSLTYNLSFQSWAGTTGRGAIDWVINSGQTDERIVNIDSNDSNPSVYTFSGLSLDGTVLTIRATEFGSDRIGHINALELTAVPEPSAYALISGILALGWIMVRRRRA